ncbi:MAG: hypothetical protein ABI405_02230 [Parafilimonas sp.]
MEVHHHPKVEKKNFKEYFLEFLMIFLAVTLGFFAENIRENISDNKQENEYARSMIIDLKNDANMYNSFDSLSLGYCNMVDTILGSLKINSPNTGKMYYLARRLTMLGSAAPSLNAKTYLQMTSTGAFRVIKHQRIADSIALYYQLMKSFDSWSDIERTRVNSLIAVNDKLFNADVFFSLYKAIEFKSDSLQQIINSNPALITNDVHDINAVKMQYQYYYGFLKLMIVRDLFASAQAKKLIAVLEKEYHITE